MNEYIQKLKELSSSLKNGKVSYEKKGLRPAQDWKIMLTTTFVILCFLGAYSFYFYSKIDNGEMFVVQRDGLGKDAEINNILLKKIVEDTKAKKAYILELKQGGIPNDPSI